MRRFVRPVLVQTQPMLEPWRHPERDVRITIDGWREWGAAEGLYVVRSKSWRMVWDYILRVGPVQTWRKIRSRMAEASRNRKVYGIGVGRVAEAPEGAGFEMGERVVFFAPKRSPELYRICLDRVWVRPLSALHAREDADAESREILNRWIGWERCSGIPVDEVDVDRAFQALTPVFRELLHDVRPESDGVDAASVERIERRRGKSGEPTAVIFGLGNYAKTQIIPHIRGHLELACVHEIDPHQLEFARSLDVSLDTSPHPREDESYTAWFIAGYHHTHARLACHALERGEYAVIEKPLATTHGQYRALMENVEAMGKSRFFACFHKRYSVLHEWAREDLQLGAGGPVDMFTIVYEIPLPERHWYNWPNSGSRVISNACHWLDYFMFVNGYAEVAHYSVERLRGDDLSIVVRLENGAALSMAMTDTGSARLGVRDTIELRKVDTTVRMVDASSYHSENSRGAIRSKRVNPTVCYGAMYRRISRTIASGGEGDSLESLRSTRLMLDLEGALQSLPAPE